MDLFHQSSFTTSSESLQYSSLDVNMSHLSLEDQIADLHNDILYGDLHEVENFIKRNPQEKYAYNNRNESVKAVAFKNFRPEIYMYLIKNGFKSGPHENLKEVAMSSDVSNKFFEIHQKTAFKLNQRHLLILCFKSELHHTAPENKQSEYFKIIFDALKQLDEIPEVSLLMEILAQCPKLQIIYDFSRKSVDGIHPGKTKEIRGVTHSKEFCITIGAKKLLENYGCFEVYGTMAHEFCHYALILLFDNNCRPYEKDDKDVEEEFEAVLKACQRKDFAEHIVQAVFDNDKQTSWHAELIVRVPHMLAAYKNVPKEIKYLRGFYYELFNFFDHQLQPRLRQKFLTIKETGIIKSINKYSGLAEKLQKVSLTLKQDKFHNFNFSTRIQNFKSNCVDLTMKMIYEKLRMLKQLSSVIFIKLEHLENGNIMEDIEALMKNCESVLMIVDCDGKEKTRIVKAINACENFKKTPKIVIVSNENFEYRGVQNAEVNHSWLELTEESQKKLMETKVNFQGADIVLKDIWSEKCEQNEEIPLNELIKGNKVKIGKKYEFKGIHMNRCFVLACVKRDSNRNYNPKPPSVDEILVNIEEQKVFLLSDAPGSGKSTELKFLTMYLKKKLPNRWVYLIDLKKYVRVFESDTQDSNTLDSYEDLVNYLVENVLKLKGFESRIFSEMFKNNQVIVLMDGFDEISPSYKKFVMAFAVAIRKKTKNQLWISTRPNLEKELEKELNTIALRLTEFNKKDRKIYFETVFKREKRKYQDHQREIESFFNEIEKGNESDAAVTNPLLFRMIANLFIENPNFKLQSSNMYTIYDAFVDEMFQRLNKKGSEAGKDTSVFMRVKVNIADFHKKIAITSEFGVQSIQKFAHFYRSLSQPTDDQLYRAGLMYIGDDNKCFFVHKTFKEFFIAQTLREKCFNHEFHSKEEFAKFFDILMKVMKDDDDNYSVVRKFLDNALENFEMNRNIKNFKIAVQIGKNRVKSIFFDKTADDECFNLIRLMSQLTEDKEEVVTLWVKGMDGHDNLLIKFFKKQTVTNVEKLWECAENLFNVTQIRKLLTHKTNSGKMNCFLAAITNENSKVFYFYLKLSEKYLKDKEKKRERNFALENWQNICANEIESLKVVLPRLRSFCPSELKDSLKLFTENPENINKVCKTRDLETIKDFLLAVKEYFRDDLKDILKEIDEESKSILVDAAEKENNVLLDLIRRIIIDVNSNLTSTFSRNYTYHGPLKSKTQLKNPSFKSFKEP